MKKFYNKTVVCACDDENSEFVKYFKSNKDELKYNKLFYKSKRIDDEYEKMYVPITFLLDERIYDYDIESIEKKHKDGYFNFNRVKIKKRGK